MVSPDNIRTPKKKTDPIPDNIDLREFKRLQGLRDTEGFGIADDDYYGLLTALGFYDSKRPLTGENYTHDTDTTTAMHYYDTTLKKVPIDKKDDTISMHLGKVAEDLKEGDLYAIQDFSEASTERIKEKTHRILTDPSRAYQSKMLNMMRDRKSYLLKNYSKQKPLNMLIEYTMMNLNVNTMLLERITDVLDYQEKLYMLEKIESKPQGKQFYAEMTLVNGDPVTHLDFTDESNYRNIPAVATIKDFPKHKLLSLNVVMASGTNVHLATNEPVNSVKTTVAITPSDPYIAGVEDKFVFESLNLRASGADAAIKIIGFY